MSKNGKIDRREEAKNAAKSAANTLTPVSINKTVDIDNPYIKASNGNDLNVFDVYDNRPRLMFIMDDINNNTVMHTVRWNCDEFIAHSIAVDGCASTRTMELEALKARAQEAAAFQREVGTSNEANGRQS